jgi:hypothetical protein
VLRDRERKNDVRNLFSLCADACGEIDEIVSMEKLPRTFSESTLLHVQEPIRDGAREVEDRTSWKPEVPFMAGPLKVQ